MQVPLEISFRDVERSESLEALIREQAEKLERFAGHIVSCRIVIEKPQSHFRKESPYRVRLDLRMPPGHEVVIRREPGEGTAQDDLPKILHAVFESARRRVRELAEQQRGHTKTHQVEVDNLAFVTRKFADDGYGFLRSQDGRDIYFHRNSVLNDAFERLEVGTAVRYVEEMGNRGPQASTVAVVEPPLVKPKDLQNPEPPPGA